jgi:hypothetical protein
MTSDSPVGCDMIDRFKQQLALNFTVQLMSFTQRPLDCFIRLELNLTRL